MHDSVDAETRVFLFDQKRMQLFLGHMRRTQHRTVRQDQIWTAFTVSYSDLPSGPDRRRWLMAVLEELSQMGAIELPVRHGKRWDRTSEIPLPTTVTIAPDNTRNSGDEDWRNLPWHPRLQWIFNLRSLTSEQFAFLKRVHVGLVDGWFDHAECFKFRSLQLTGDEKRLVDFYRGILFGPDRLTLEMLGCEPDSLPLATEQFSSDPTLLIFENASPFMLARKILKNTAHPAIGRLAYGAGKQVLKAAGYLPMVEPPIREILYVGDLDAEGIAIASELQRLSVSIPVMPATEFHRAMLDSAIQLESPGGWAGKDERVRNFSETGMEFLAEELRESISNMLRDSHRIPEEALSFAAMSKLLVAELA